MGLKHGGRRKSGLKKVVRLTVIGLTIAAVVKELRSPADERTWHGIVAGCVPYEFRPPTLERVRDRVWNPEGEYLLSPQAFGVGWTLNLGRVFAEVKGFCADAR